MYILIFFLFSLLIPDTIHITSQIVNLKNEPISNVNVHCNESYTKTNQNGIFIIDCDVNDTIQINHIGYVSENIEANKIKNKITLENKIIKSNDIIVYGGLEDSNNSNITILNNIQKSLKDEHHIDNILPQLQNINFAGGTSRYRYIQIRGLGELSQFAGEGPPHFYTSFIVDDINFSGVGMGMLSDIKQIEVFKGPQSYSYGPNSMGGIINLVSYNPNYNREIISNFNIGNYNTFNKSLILSGPVNNKILFRLTFVNNTTNGPINNIFKNSDKTTAKNENLVRSKIIYNPNTTLNVKITNYYINIKNKYDNWTPDNNGFNTYTDYQGLDNQETIASSVNIEIKNNDYTLNSITTYSENNIIYSYDSDWANNQYWYEEPYNWDPSYYYYEWNFTDSTSRKRINRSQEIRFKKTRNKQTLTTGIFYSHLKENDLRSGWLFGGNADYINSIFNIKNYALYQQLKTNLNEKITSKITIRYDRIKTNQDLYYSYEYYNIDNTITSKSNDVLIGFNFELNCNLTKELNIHGNLSRGYKTSGINQSPNFENYRIYKAEQANAIELGIKYKHENIHFTMNAFYMHRHNPQLRLFVQFDLANPNSFDYATFNANNGYISGLEADIDITINPKLSYYLKYGLLSTYVSSFIFNNATYGDRALAHSPNHSGSLGLAYNIIDNLKSTIDITFKDKFYFDEQNNHMSNSYKLINWSLNYKINKFAIGLWVNNIQNIKYATRGYTFALDPTYEVKDWQSYGMPRTMGLSMNIKL